MVYEGVSIATNGDGCSLLGNASVRDHRGSSSVVASGGTGVSGLIGGRRVCQSVAFSKACASASTRPSAEARAGNHQPDRQPVRR